MKPTVSQMALVDNVVESIPAGLLYIYSSPSQVASRARHIISVGLFPEIGAADFLTSGVHFVAGCAAAETGSRLVAVSCRGWSGQVGGK